MAFAMFVVAAPTSSATDICSDVPLSSADFNVEITSGVYLRDISCMDSNVVATLSAGEVVHVIGLTEGWHKIQRADGTVGWIWETFVTQTSKPFNPTTTVPEPELISYDPMYDIDGHKYEDAIWYVYNNGIVQGYPDGSYQPDRTINRAELLKIIVESSYTDEFNAYEGQGCFTDVSASEWYAKYICFAKDEGLVEGYPDGSFKPAQEINFVEALKIAMIGFGYEYTEGDPWYEPTVVEASNNNFIPIDVYSFSQAFKRGQMAELITRMMKYNDGTLEDYDQTGDTSYFVTYQSIAAGLNVEDYVGSGQCISEGEVYESGAELFPDCVCGQGTWECEELPDLPVDCGSDQSCFEGYFATCSPAFFEADIGIASYYYEITGLQGELCAVDSHFTNNPNPDYLEKEMTCLYDNSLDFEDAIQDMSTCEGELADILNP